MQYFCGVDIGASAVKLVIIDAAPADAGSSRRPIGGGLRPVGRSLSGRGPVGGEVGERAVAAVRVHRLRPRQRALGGRNDDRDRLPRQRSLLPFSSADDGDRHRGPGQQDDPSGRSGTPHRFQDEPQVRGGHGGLSGRDRPAARSARRRTQRTGRAVDQRGDAGQFLHRLHRHRDPGEDPRGRASRGHRERGVSLGREADPRDGHASRARW